MFMPQEGQAQSNPSRRESTRGASGLSSALQISDKTIKTRQPESSSIDPQRKNGGSQRDGASEPVGPSQFLTHTASQNNIVFESPAQASRQRSPKGKESKDQGMSVIPDHSTSSKVKAGLAKEQLSFSLPQQEDRSKKTREENSNPFASLGEGRREVGGISKSSEDPSECSIFKAEKGNARASPRLVNPQVPSHTPQREVTPGGKIGPLHSDVHQSFFSSLGITVSLGRKPFRARLWPVIIRYKNAQKEMLMRFKEHTPPSLPLNIRLKGPAEELEEEWSTDVALGELIHRVEVELKDQTLRYYFSINEKPRLEWSWQDEPNRGGMECTILVFIHTGLKGVSVQKKKNLHWITLDHTPDLNNEIAFTIVAHNLLMRKGEVDSSRQELRNRSASIQASP